LEDFAILKVNPVYVLGKLLHLPQDVVCEDKKRKFELQIKPQLAIFSLIQDKVLP
jgi:hypothetical protein